MNNLFRDIPGRLPEEYFETLAASKHVEVERIVSRGHRSPSEGWYDQGRNEFVVLLKGSACLEFEDGRTEELLPGDWLDIPAHCRHRVAWTLEGGETVWLAVHYR